MAAIPYVGATQASVNDLVNRNYVTNLLGLNLGQVLVDTLINAGLTGFVTKTYVDTQDALNATKSFIDTGDATRMKLSQIGVNSGAAGLLVSGRIESSRIGSASTQRWPKPFYTPTAYNTATITATSSEVTVYTCPVADPGYAYKLFVSGVLDGSTSVDGEYPIVRVRQGSTTGQVVAGGFGLGEKYSGGVMTQFTTAGSYTIPSWATNLDIVLLGGGGGGNGTTVFSFFNGPDGSAGAWTTMNLIRGSTIPSGTATISFAPGGGGTGGASSIGATGSSGGATTFTAAGYSGANSAAGGAGGSGTASVAAKTYNGQTYTGGAGGTAGGAGGFPGAGGGGGGAFSAAVGGNGAGGSAWVVAYGAATTPSGPVAIAPTAINAQTVITGATTLYVTVVRSGSASTQSISTLLPKLFAIPIPA